MFTCMSISSVDLHVLMYCRFNMYISVAGAEKKDKKEEEMETEK